MLGIRGGTPGSALAFVVLALAMCREAPGGPTAPAAAQTAPLPPPVSEAEGPYMLRYFAPATGELLAVRTPAQVPEGARGQVIVSPEDPALQGPWLFVADLTQKVGAGYSVRVVDRSETEASRAAVAPTSPGAPSNAAAASAVARASLGSGAALHRGGSAGGPPAAGVGASNLAPVAGAVLAGADREVILYRTPWCGYCKKAGQYLKLKGVPFIEKDIEQDPGARADMLARAQRAGVPASALQGVPILYVRGKIISGFNRDAIDRALAGG
ncbi:MAG: hypothetical protein EXR79_14180 [Myxococcales bacterium]|nr:hypothetical protein [Myxococcales bacterium]